MVHHRIHFILLLLLCKVAYAQPYKVGIPVRDTLGTITSYHNLCQSPGADVLSIALDSTLIPYVAGLAFQLEITAIEGRLRSNVSSDTLAVGDILPLPATADSGILKISMAPASSFQFITTIVGTPTVANERYYCNIYDAVTLATCNNFLSYFGEGEICTVQPATSVNDRDDLIPAFALAQNYPNPFNPSTTIQFAMPKTAVVKLEVYATSGRRVAILFDKPMPAGFHKVKFKAQDLATGVYVIRLEVGPFRAARKMLYLR